MSLRLLRFWLRLLSVLLLCLLLFGMAQAQGVLTYGESITGTISAQTPLALYSFQGSAGDLITAEASATSAELDPTLTLLGPGGAALANNDNDPFSPGTGDARLSYRLTQGGVYSLLVGSANNTLGDFALRLTARAISEAPAPLDGVAQVDLTTGAQILVIPGDPAAPTPITIQSDPPGAAFSVEVRDPSGQIIAIFSGLPSVSLLLPAAAGDFEITVTPTGPGAQGVVSVSQDDGPVDAPIAEPTEAAEPPPPAATEEVSAGGPPAGVCSVTAAGNVTNVRGGPGTDFEVVAQLSSGQYLEVAGVNGLWYAVNLPDGGTGWVRSDVVLTSGPCANLPQVPAPSAPQAPAATEDVGSGEPAATLTPTTSGQPVSATPTYTPTYTATASSAQPSQPTATSTPSYTPTTPPPPPVAPADARFNSPLNIPLDSTVSVTDFVSYPGGDQEDRVAFSVTGMNPNAALSGGRARLILAVSCFGTGTDQVQFFTGGQTYSCGQTIVDREVTFDSNTGSVVITAVGGTNTYVQWVLTGTATRVN